MSLNKNSLLEHNQNGPIKNSGGILSVNPEICTVLISDFFHHSNPGSQLPAKIWQKDKKRKNKEWNPSSTIRSHLSGRIISSSRRIYLSMNNKTESFFICWFWVYQLFSQCHYSRKHYDTSPPPSPFNNRCPEPQLSSFLQTQAKRPLSTVLWGLPQWNGCSSYQVSES